MSSDAQSWTCPNCSEQIEPQFDGCWKCGADKEGNVEADSAESVDAERPVAMPSNSYVGWSVFACVLFLPLGLLALVLSVLAEVAIIHGDLDKAREYSQQASAWRFVAFVCTF
jgi:hypothetical protein